MFKKGDTLIEVTLAIGIFSMVAISIAAVLSGGTAGAQTSLETTLTREEIDTQAEAIRFIHTAYSANKNDTHDNGYQDAWKAITDRALEKNENYTDESELAAITNYSPTTCQAIYSETRFTNHAFVINPRMLSDSVNFSSSDNTSEVVLVPSTNRLQPATLYPRLIFSLPNNLNSQEVQGTLISDADRYTRLASAEGIYVIAVHDTGTTTVVDENGAQADQRAFYDFYIRSCWYGMDTEAPSYISTVIRLADPDAVEAVEFGTVRANFNSNYAEGPKYDETISRKVTLPTLSRYGYYFAGWCSGSVVKAGSEQVDDECVSGELFPGDKVITNGNANTTDRYNFTAVWERNKYRIQYDINYPYTNEDALTMTFNRSCPGLTNCQLCYQTDNTCYVAANRSSNIPVASGYKFVGWCTSKVSAGGTCSGTQYNTGSPIDLTASTPAKEAELKRIFSSPNNTLKLYGLWKENNETIRAVLTWGSSPSDLDSYVTGQKSDNTTFTAYYGSKIGSDVSGLTIASLDQDVTSGYGPETFIINTLGGKTYYYSVRNYSSSSNITNATVTVYVDGVLTNTFYASNASGSGRVWNVFAYKNGKIVPKQTRSAEALNNY